MDNACASIPRYSSEQYEKAFLYIFEKCSFSAEVSVEKKIIAYSSFFVGKPLLNGALGEGVLSEFDQGPLFRNDAFDCVTLVSTVLAMSFANNFYEFKEKLVQLNYLNAGCAYRFRHHFVSVDWNLENEKQGFVKDITESIVDESNNSVAEIASAFIDRPNWFLHRSADDIKRCDQIENEQQAKTLLLKLKGFSEKARGVYAATPYLPLNRLFHINGAVNKTIWDQIPSGVVVEIVRPNWQMRDKIGTNLNISHMGFVFRKGDTLIFRHASQLHKKVVDVPLETYLFRYLESPTIKGINLQQPLIT
jgi:hypothetical protein